MTDILTGPLPSAIPGVVFSLTDAPEDVQLTPGLLADYPFGLVAFAGDDNIIGSTDSELIFGNQGADTIQGGEGDDTIPGGQENDTIDGGLGNDILFGNKGDDTVWGGDGNDIIFGGQDNDTISGGSGTDVIQGDLGDDTLLGEGGLDLLKGGEGNDLFQLRFSDFSNLGEIGAGGGNADIITDFNAAADRITILGGVKESDLRLDFVSAQAISLPPALSEAVVSGVIPLSELDPNGDGLFEGTALSVVGTGIVFGFVLNATPDQISGRILDT
ncbi:MAG TPA: hypothetical protein IGS17_07235 [Oscillatoriales cyanobacterium M59_W2019_021]|nr:hypothetical protein [Oscillatoriales cyanobacterium M4454_W2019_049]HIK50704.1 hypothetical protein [Oscillatoriales cyanobacterium M59_W2019_021]